MKTMLTRITQLTLSACFIFLFQGAIQAQLDNPVTWAFSQEKISDTETELIFTASIEEGWNVYSQFLAEDSTPLPTAIEYDNLAGVALSGESVETGKRKEGMDPIFKENVIKFLSDKPYVIKQRVKTTDGWSATGFLEFMTCNDEKCLPPTAIDFSFAGNGNGSTDVAAATETTPTTPIDNSKTGATAAVLTEDNPVAWTYAMTKGSGTNEYDLSLTATILDGWIIYSHYVEDGGPLPTYVDFETAEGFDEVGVPVETGKMKKSFDKIFSMDVAKFTSEEPYNFGQKFTNTSGSGKGNVYLSYMSCNDEKCVPFDEELILDTDNLKVYKASEDVTNAALSNIEGNQIDQIRPQIIETYKAPIGDCGVGDNKESSSYWSIFLIGFLGGLFAILLPCIFPMIPITVSYFMKDNKRKGWVNGLIYGLSIVVIFVAIGLLVTALLGPEALNKLSTNWIANTLFFVVFIAFAISFFGYFEIALPSSWSTKSDSMADKGGLLGTFFMAATLAIVSFSCTGPIIGTALVQVASQGDYWGPFSVMLGFSTALALPFGLFAAFPSWLNTLPRSGSWMNSVKVVLGFVELALALKFLSVADLTEHWGFLRYELFLFLWILIFAAMAAYLFGFIKFPHDSPLKKLSPVRLGFAGIAIAAVVYLSMGFRVDDTTSTYKSPGLTSGIAPPATYNFFLDPPAIPAELTAKYPSISKCANNITCFKDYFEGLAYAREANKPVFLDFTGYGCVNCRKTEEHIWVDDKVRKMLDQEYVLISLYVDDREKLEQQLVSKSRGNKIRNVGNKWSDFQIVNFEQNSQPLYVLMTPEEDVIASPRGYRDGITQYMDYLECGLKYFSETNGPIGAIK